MRLLKRNRIPLYYANREIIGTDKMGNPEYGYPAPTRFLANVSPAAGELQQRQFGEEVIYERTIATDQMNFPVDHDTRFWIGIEPTKKHNYVTAGIARSKYSIVVAIKEVNVS